MSEREALIQTVSKNNPELSRLVVEHRHLDHNLVQLQSQGWLTPQERDRLKHMKRLKLMRRDCIEEILDRYR